MECGNEISLKAMSRMVNCNVLLNRNFLDLSGSVKKKSMNKNDKKQKEVAESSDRNAASESEQSESETSDSSSSSSGTEKNSKMRKRNEKRNANNDQSDKVKQLSCVFCEKKFKTYASYLVHKSIHKTIKFKCVLCKLTCNSRPAYVNHMKSDHPEVEMFPCEYPSCEKSYRTKKMLQDHVKSHCKYMCRFCKKRFASRRQMRKHVLKIHY